MASSEQRQTRSTPVLEVGSKVTTGIGGGKKATVSFIGETQFAAGEWIGLTYDGPDGKIDGSQGGVSYFKCKPLHGAFVKRALVKLDKEASSTSSAPPIDQKDKLAALREKRRIREAGSTSISSITATAASVAVPLSDDLPGKSDPKILRSASEDEGEDEVETAVTRESTEDENYGRLGLSLNLGVSIERDSLLKQKVLELSSTVECLELDKETSLKEMSAMKIAIDAIQKQLIKSQQEAAIMTEQLVSSKARESDLVIAAASNDTQGRESELEAQVNELMDTLEILTLDKEQLVMENELLQAQIDDTAGLAEQPPSSAQSSAVEENAKLREALRRLHSQSTNDKSLLDALNEKQEKDEKELVKLREDLIRADAELLELREAVDAAASYESMIESLTEKNLEFSQTAHQLESTVRDLEEQQELSEELDQQQRADLDLTRKELDSSKMQIYERESVIHSQEAKIEDLKKINEKFRRTAEQLRAEVDHLRSQVTMTAAESDRMLVRARAAATSHIVQAEMQEKILGLTSELNRNTASVNLWKASHARMYCMFGRSSLYSAEGELCAREVAALAAATHGSTVSQSLLGVIMKRIEDPSGDRERTSMLSTLSDEDDSTLRPLHAPRAEVEATLIRQMLLLLRATCALWQCVGFVLADSLGASSVGALAAAATSMQHLIEAVRSVLEQQQQGISDITSASASEEKVFTELESLTQQTEELLHPHTAALGLCALPPVPSFLTGRKGLVQGGELGHAVGTLGQLSDANISLRRFHLSCQSSYLSLGSDLLAAYVSSRTSSSALSSSLSPTSSPLTTSTRLSLDEDESKVPTPLSHSAALADLCRTIRLDLESLGLMAPGGLLYVSAGPSGTSGKEEHSDISHAIKTCLAECFEQLLDIAVTSHTPRVDEVAASPAQLRACLSRISQIRNFIAPQNARSRSVEGGSDTINVINLVSSIDVEKLWHAVISTDERNADVGGGWDSFCVWRHRAGTQRDLLLVCEESQTELGSMKQGLLLTQRELQSKIDELKAAKSANLELNNLLQNSQPTSPLSGVVERGAEENAHVSSSVRSRKSSEAPCPIPEGEVAKLKAEIEVLTSALTVLEIQFVGAERENKRIRNAGRTTDPASSSRLAATLAEMVRVWRGIAAHKLMGSMTPLPAPVPQGPTPKPTQMGAPSNNFLGDGSEAEAVPVDTISPLNAYRELRKLRSTVRVSVNRAPGPEGRSGSPRPKNCPPSHGVRGLPLHLGTESRAVRAGLIEKYTQSIILCGGSLVL